MAGLVVDKSERWMVVGEQPRDTHGYTGEEMPEVEPDLRAGSGGSSQSVRLAVLGKRCRK